MEALERENTGFSDLVNEVWCKPKALHGAALLWKVNHEKKVKSRYQEKLNQKKNRDLNSEKEVSQLVARKLPFDYLAQDWLEEQKVSAPSL